MQTQVASVFTVKKAFVRLSRDHFFSAMTSKKAFVRLSRCRFFSAMTSKNTPFSTGATSSLTISSTTRTRGLANQSLRRL
jgi:hypothetical protein